MQESTEEADETKEPDETKGDKQENYAEIVEESYFDDAAFIGDSRTEGFGMYAGLKKATFFTLSEVVRRQRRLTLLNVKRKMMLKR